MRKPLQHLLIIIAFLSCFNQTCFAQAQQPKFSLRVSLNVSADEVIQSEVLSNINSGLRALGDVVIVNDDPKLQVSIVAIRNTSVGGRDYGYTLSIVVTKGFERSEVQGVTKAWAKNEAAQQLLVDVFGAGVILVHHSIVTGGELQDVCKRAVATIDVGPIEYERKYWQDIQDNTKRVLELKKKYPDKSLLELQEMVDKERRKP